MFVLYTTYLFCRYVVFLYTYYMATSKKDWYVYILECGDGTLYTGVTVDLDRRLEEHKQGVGSKYTKSKKAKRFVYTENCPSRSEAGKRETEIKHMTRKEKLSLIT
jgi:putative endonuclease